MGNIIKSLNGAFSTEQIEISRASIFNVAYAFEEFVLNYGKLHLVGTRSSQEIHSHKLVLRIQKGQRQNASDFYLGKEEWQASINVPSANFAKNGSVVVGIVYKDLHDLLAPDQPIRIKAGNRRHLSSGIMAVAMAPNPDKLRENVILKFRNLEVKARSKLVDKGEKKCIFWSGLSEGSEGFSGRGCYVVTSKSNSEETVCSCNHLTHFAVLVDYDDSLGLTLENEAILQIITYVALSFSITGILLTIIVESFITDFGQPLSQIRLSLSVSLGAGQIIFLAGIKATENRAFCVTAAALSQYFLMAAFCWMMVEGVYLYLFVVKVYIIGDKMHTYHVISWGFPIVMVGISLSVAAGKDGIQSYTSEKYCWLSSTNNLIWIFVAFVALVEVVNILILIQVHKKMSTLVQPMVEDKHFRQIRVSIKTCAMMVPLLGVTWLFGLLLPLQKAFAYIFTILNFTQGFLIFALHRMRNRQIRERLRSRLNTIFPYADDGNFAEKSSQRNLSDAGNVSSIELGQDRDVSKVRPSVSAC
nr:adhesion G protein-coupled receptor L4-like [Pocillopora verrucosa]